MRINKSLNLVIPITDAEDKITAYVHSSPISSDVFDAFFLPIAKTFSSIYGQGLGMLAGPRIADKLLKKISIEMDVWEGPTGVQAGLVSEIHRLTNVLTVGKSGWETLPFGVAKSKGIIDSDDAAEVDAALIFFTVCSVMHRKSDVPGILGGAMKLWGAQIESLNSTEYINFLTKSTPAEHSGATAAA